MTSEVLIGIDIGGTFTDFVIFDPGEERLETFKLLSTPENPANAVLEGLRKISRKLGGQTPMRVIHGSTVATNALLERKGARTALIATRGFKDVLQIGRQNRPELYTLSVKLSPELVPQELRFEVDERVAASGEVLLAIDPAQIQALVPELSQRCVESIAVCLLFSFLHPQHERQITDTLRKAGFFVSASNEVLPEFREFERSSTTAINAYVSPILDRYLSRLQNAAGDVALEVLQSNGGRISVNDARKNGVRCILSGPAGGVIGAQAVAGAGANVITFDMGGTSTDVSLIAGSTQTTTAAFVGDFPIAIPLLDIHTIGAGGGSIAHIDAGGALRVGPQSAGAHPGPACYGQGKLPTVTDANLVLGRLSANHFLDGQIRLESQRAWDALRQLSTRLGSDPIQAALGVIDVVNAHMERALRVISIERGYDPRDFSLLSFGGAGGLHASGLARRLGIPSVLIPPLASTLSAFGMLNADVIKDYVQTVMLPGDTPLHTIRRPLAELTRRAMEDLIDYDLAPTAIQLEPAIDLRYRGQSYELTVPFGESLVDDFHAAHERAYGYARPDHAVEIVNLRLRVVGKVQPPRLAPHQFCDTDASPACIGEQMVVFAAPQAVPVYRGEALLPGNRIVGPSLVIRSDTTVLIEPGDHAEIDEFGNVGITISNGS